MTSSHAAPDAERSTIRVPTQRLLKRRDFLAARAGARAHSPYFVLQLHNRGDGNGALRVGFTVTKKIGNAVVRNRVRRRLRAAVELAEIPALAAGHDAVVIAKEAAFDAPHTELVASLSRAFSKAVQPKPAKALQKRSRQATPAPDKRREMPQNPCIASANVARERPKRSDRSGS